MRLPALYFVSGKLASEKERHLVEVSHACQRQFFDFSPDWAPANLGTKRSY
jgi:hypothetical protein